MLEFVVITITFSVVRRFTAHQLTLADLVASAITAFLFVVISPVGFFGSMVFAIICALIAFLIVNAFPFLYKLDNVVIWGGK